MTGAAESSSTGWRRGSVVTPIDQLAEHLLAVGSHHARIAVRDAGVGDGLVQLDAAIHAGGAIEMVAKAAIAEFEPLLLSSGSINKGELLDALAALKDVGIRATRMLRTIDASVAVDMVGRIHPSCAVQAKAASQVLDVRNAAVHMGTVDPGHLAAAVGAMAAYINAILDAQSLDPELFWQEEASEARRLQEARSRRLKRIAEYRIGIAKQVFDLKVETWGEEHREGYIQGLERVRPTFDETLDVDCPACGRSAVLGWTADIEVERDSDGDYYAAVGGMDFEGLRCPVCDLSLDADEAQATGFDGTWVPSPPEVDFYPDWLDEVIDQTDTEAES
ncbi:hypothetical protein [Cellulomonas sp. Leaf395]|uniref:hypothetical protein n=1 Tax=Cellulomonas sp. Leaf395 TaxID=1736362 RepID=UPI0012F8A94F|nr:hypothetical protein [Cellulomonas sp. Leaf395]